MGYFRNDGSGKIFFASFHPGWQARAIGSLIFPRGIVATATIALTIGPTSTESRGKMEDGTDDDAGSGAHPRSDVGLDKWRLAIKSIRRDMALSC